MPVTDFLDRNAREYPNEIALVELNPDEKDTRRTTWKKYDLIQPDRSSQAPDVKITEKDFGAIYFSSGTTGFPKAILHKYQSQTQAAEMEQKHHGTGHSGCSGQERFDTLSCQDLNPGMGSFPRIQSNTPQLYCGVFIDSLTTFAKPTSLTLLALLTLSAY